MDDHWHASAKNMDTGNKPPRAIHGTMRIVDREPSCARLFDLDDCRECGNSPKPNEWESELR